MVDKIDKSDFKSGVTAAAIQDASGIARMNPFGGHPGNLAGNRQMH